MSLTNNLFDECIKRDANTPLEFKLLKLSEEVGELSAEFIKYKKASNASASAVGDGKELLTEAVDVFIVITDILGNLEKLDDCKDYDTGEIIDKKLEKWKAKLDKRDAQNGK